MRKDMGSVPSPFGSGGFSAYWAGSTEVSNDHAGYLIGLTALAVIYVLLMLRFCGATLGQLLVGLRVRRRDPPGAMPWSTCMIRALCSVTGVALISALVVTSVSPGVGLAWTLATYLYLAADGLWPLWDPNRQALHDKIAGTNVITIN